MARIDVLGVGFDNLTMDEAINKAMTMIENRESAYVVTPNPEIVMLANENEKFKTAVNEADLVLADGIGIIKAASILGTPLCGRVTGIDFATNLMAELAKIEGSVYLFGAKPTIADKAAEKLMETYKGLRVVGTSDGYFKDDTEIIEKIKTAKPDFLIVCLGAPKQEFWIRENLKDMDVGIAAGLGGSLDVLSGEVERAPEFFQKIGMEWFYRLVKEPSRIKRMAKLPLFLVDATLVRVRGKKSGK